MENNRPTGEQVKQGNFKDFYKNIFGWKWAYYDQDIDSWLVYTDDPEVPPRIMTRRDKIGVILEPNGPVGDEPKTVGVFEVSDVKELYEAIEQNRGKVLIDGIADANGYSYFAICNDDEGNQFIMIEHKDSNFSQNNVAEILSDISQ